MIKDDNHLWISFNSYGFYEISVSNKVHCNHRTYIICYEFLILVQDATALWC